MEQKIFSKLNIYDQIGYLMVGAVTLMLAVFNAAYFLKISIPIFNLDTFLVWFIAAYFMGHFVQGIANLFNEIKFLRFLVPENKEDFSEKHKEVLQQAKDFFGLQKQGDKELWDFCYMLANAKDVTGQVQSFNSYYSMYRGWFVVFILETLFIGYFVILTRDVCTTLLFLLSLIFAIIFYRRSKRFWTYTRSKVLETFMVVKILKL